jgi:flagellar basal-body rod protein FlgB
MSIQSIFNDGTIKKLKDVLDHTNARQKTVASNVANVNTPGYKTKDVSFESVLKAKYSTMRVELKTTNPRHIDTGFSGPRPIDYFYAYRPADPHDGINDVDLDKEMLKESEISTNFDLFAQFLTGKYDGISRVVSGNV